MKRISAQYPEKIKAHGFRSRMSTKAEDLF